MEVAPAIENKADQKIPIQSESQITEEQAITKPPSPIEEIRTTTEIITNTVPINNIIKVIETQPQVSQTINIVTNGSVPNTCTMENTIQSISVAQVM